MKNLFTLLILLFLWAGISFAQVSNYTFASSAGAYTPLATETILWSASFDDNSSVGITIPSMTVAGAAYTTMFVQANGWITLGGTLISSSYTPISQGTSYPVVISAFGRDLNNAAAGTPKISYNTNDGGEIVVQYQDVRRYAVTGEMFSFQIRLKPSTGDIKFVYGGTITGGTSTSYPQVGLRGSTNAVYNNRTTTTDWAATTAGASNTATCLMSATVTPTVGLTYMFSPPTIPALFGNPGTLSLGYAPSSGYSTEQTYSLSGNYLTGSPIVVTAPAGFEVSLTSGFGFGSSVDVSFTPPTLASTTIFTRFAPSASNTDYSGNITMSVAALQQMLRLPVLPMNIKNGVLLTLLLRLTKISSTLLSELSIIHQIVVPLHQALVPSKTNIATISMILHRLNFSRVHPMHSAFRSEPAELQLIPMQLKFSSTSTRMEILPMPANRFMYLLLLQAVHILKQVILQYLPALRLEIL
jgi:hypothetical protein